MTNFPYVTSLLETNRNQQILIKSLYGSNCHLMKGTETISLALHSVSHALNHTLRNVVAIEDGNYKSFIVHLKHFAQPSKLVLL